MRFYENEGLVFCFLFFWTRFVSIYKLAKNIIEGKRVEIFLTSSICLSFSKLSRDGVLQRFSGIITV